MECFCLKNGYFTSACIVPLSTLIRDWQAPSELYLQASIMHSGLHKFRGLQLFRVIQMYLWPASPQSAQWRYSKCPEMGSKQPDQLHSLQSAYLHCCNICCHVWEAGKVHTIPQYVVRHGIGSAVMDSFCITFHHSLCV